MSDTANMQIITVTQCLGMCSATRQMINKQDYYSLTPSSLKHTIKLPSIPSTQSLEVLIISSVRDIKCLKKFELISVICPLVDIT